MKAIPIPKSETHKLSSKVAAKRKNRFAKILVFFRISFTREKCENFRFFSRNFASICFAKKLGIKKNDLATIYFRNAKFFYMNSMHPYTIHKMIGFDLETFISLTHPITQYTVHTNIHIQR